MTPAPTPCADRYEVVCKNEFVHLAKKIDRLDEAVRGNGKVGILTRLDRLEGWFGLQGRLLWSLVGALTGIVGTVAVRALTGI